MSFPSIINRGEFFSSHYLDSVISSDLDDLRRRWDSRERGDVPTGRARIKGMAREFYAARGAAVEAKGTSRSDDAARALNDVILRALGFEPNRSIWELTRAGEAVHVPIAHLNESSTGPLLVAVDAQFATNVDQLFGDVTTADTPTLLGSVERTADKKSVSSVPDAIGEIFSTDEPPRYVLVIAGTTVLLGERTRWAEGRFLAVDLDSALARNDARAKGELETIAALFSADALVPDGDQSVIDELVDQSHKHAVGVSKELRNGLRESVEILANEVVQQRWNRSQLLHDRRLSSDDATDLTRQCLRYLYRLLVLLYAESRPELGILPVNDDAYLAGYSLDRLRELVLVDLETDKARHGNHLHESLSMLFDLVNNGNHVEHAEQQLPFNNASDSATSEEVYLQFPGLDAALFEPESTKLLNEVELRNEALQQVLRKLMWAPGRGRSGAAGFISYAQLGINQLGAVYEGLMAYSGFFADEDLYEVAKNGDPSDGTWMLPVSDAGDYPEEVFVTRENPTTGSPERILHPRNSFVYRLSGRDRQRTASYYTPEVLTRCVVKHALAELLGLDDHAPENGSSRITSAVDILDLTICEPALGSGAFANEAITQLAAVYLQRRQTELGESLDPERYRFELQKVKAHFALHQTYGVDLNATAVELAEVSLWLNCMYPGLKAPWFGLQLRRGNSLLGCRRATWTTDQLVYKPWKETRRDHLRPPLDRRLDVPLGDNEIHHFLLPGHGWGSVADRKEARELRPSETKALKSWRRKILNAPTVNDSQRLTQLASAVEELWNLAASWIETTQRQLRRPIDVYGAEIARGATGTSRDSAYGAIRNPDTPLGRLRTVMDAWTGLWFWPLDTGAEPPNWSQWLHLVEELVRPDQTHGLAGQLDIFADYQAMLEVDENQRKQQATLDTLCERHQWLTIALKAAEREGAWHWDLEFAPVFKRGGFDLQVGNPPWVRPVWFDDLVLAELDPWWGITENPGPPIRRNRRAHNLTSPTTQDRYLAELTSAEGVVKFVGSPVLRPVLTGVQTNLYMAFMDTVLCHLSDTGTAGLLHPESHFTDPKAGALRRETYAHLKRHFIFSNERILFEDVGPPTVFGINIYGATGEPRFKQAAYILVPDTIDRSLEHDGTGPVPGIQHPEGGGDLRPHKQRVLTITEEILTDWAKLFDEPGTPGSEARLLRPVTVDDLDSLSVLAAQPVRLADHDYRWTRGWEETSAKSDGFIRWDTATPAAWDEAILQGPHFTVATPFAKQPNENCKSKGDWSEWDLETLPEREIPRTNYQRACDFDTYLANLNHWNGEPCTKSWRVAYRRMTNSGLERSLHVCVVPPGPAHVHTVLTMALSNEFKSTVIAGLWSSLPFDYLVKVSGKPDVQDELVKRFPAVFGPYSSALVLRTLRLNCLTANYRLLWESLFDPDWTADSWTDLAFQRLDIGDVAKAWSGETPLRRDFERRLALVELDALAALMLGLSAEQLCSMYRTQFAVLRKYEHKMVFDAEGRKICGYHHSAGYRQSQLQDQAKAGELTAKWKNLWKLYEEYEEDPDSVDWRGHYTPPFTRADREMEMTRAYNEFQRRLDAGEIPT